MGRANSKLPSFCLSRVATRVRVRSPPVDSNQAPAAAGATEKVEGGGELTAERRRVMVAVDSGTEAKSALLWALSHAVQSNDSLVLLKVSKPASKQGGDQSPWERDPKGYEVLQGMKSICQSRRPEAQGIRGPAYKFFHGSTTEAYRMYVDSMAKSMELSHNIFPKVQPHIHSWIKEYGKNVLTWHGSRPTLVIGEAVLVKEILNDKNGAYPKGETPKFFKKLLGDGVAMAKGEKWARQRKLVTQAFRAECLKGMIREIVVAVESILLKWDELDVKEVDLFKEFSFLTSEVISRSAFGSSYSEGKNIFIKLDQLAGIVARNSQKIQMPFLSKFIQSQDDIESSKIEQEIRESILKIVRNREERKEKGEIAGYGDDLLGILMSAHHEIDKEERITMEDVIDECKTFYFGGQETTASMLSWTSLLLAVNQDWQERARAEAMELFGGRSPTSDDSTIISRLKMMTMIINESMRLYPPILNIMRTVAKTSTLGNQLVLPKGMGIHISPTIIHHDRNIWGDDVHLFKPERFANGVAGAMARKLGEGGHSSTTFFPFGGGPRFCVGQGLALVEAKVALTMILQRYKLKVSPGYIHSPIARISIRPQYGLQVLLQKL